MTSERPKVLPTRQGFFPFWLGNVLRATTACTFSTCQLPKAVRHCGIFLHFDLEMCFAPQRRALFWYRDFQKWSGREVFLHFYFHMCFAPQRRAFFQLSSRQMAPHPPNGSPPAALASLLFDSPPEPQIIGKTQRFATFVPFLLTLSLLWSSLFFSSLTLPTSAFPSVHIVGSLTSKLPSTVHKSEIWHCMFSLAVICMIKMNRHTYIYNYIYIYIYMFIYIIYTYITEKNMVWISHNIMLRWCPCYGCPNFILYHTALW